jgi:hypothetical protein
MRLAAALMLFMAGIQSERSSPDHADQQHDDGDHEQDVDQPTHGVRGNQAQQPKDDQNGVLARPFGLIMRRVVEPESMRKVCLYAPATRALSPAAEGFAEFPGTWIKRWWLDAGPRSRGMTVKVSSR